MQAEHRRLAGQILAHHQTQTGFVPQGYGQGPPAVAPDQIQRSTGPDRASIVQGAVPFFFIVALGAELSGDNEN